MADATYTIEYEGSLESLYAKLDQLPAMLASDSPFGHQALRAIGSEVLNSFADEFWTKAGGGRDRFGEQWLPLAPSTIKKKGHDAILIESMDLYNSLRPGAQDNILDTAPGLIRVGTADEKSVFHQVGFMGGWKHDQWVPPRRVLPEAERLDDDWWEEMLENAMPAITQAVVSFIGTGAGG